MMDFTSIVQCGELLYSLVIDDGDETYFGRTAPQMQNKIAVLREVDSINTYMVIIVNILAFGKDDPAEYILKTIQCLNMKHNVMVLTGSGLVSVQGNSHNAPIHTGKNADGSPTIEIYNMEARLNRKEFNLINTVKCSGKGFAMEWYESIGVQGRMWGVFITPSFSLVKKKPRVSLWDKRLVGATFHAPRILMSCHVHNALTHPLMFPKDGFGDQCRDIVTSSGCCGYAALHKMMRLVRPSVSEKL
jgi:hypothetical protein